jgi:hypothetical protein
MCLLLLGACQTASPNQIETFRSATRTDLSLGLLSVKTGPNGFPQVIVNLRSLTSDEIIVSYAPNSLAIHCGPFVALGPPVTYGIRREILDAYGYMDFPPPTSGWHESPEPGQIQLLYPTRLPPNSYPVWATFYVPGPQGGILQTPHQLYVPIVINSASRK